MDFKKTFLGFYFVGNSHEVSDEENGYEFIFHDEAFKKCYNNKLFLSEDEYYLHGSIQKISVVFNTIKRKCYFINSTNLKAFLQKYFPAKKTIIKKPVCYFFLNPTFKHEQSDSENLIYNPIYHKNYIELKKNLTNYEFYLNELIKTLKVLNKEPVGANNTLNNLNINKLIRPIYELSTEEKEEYDNFYSEAECNFYQAMQDAIDQEQDRLRDQEFDGMVDEWNDNAYERKHNWNFDDEMNYNDF